VTHRAGVFQTHDFPVMQPMGCACRASALDAQQHAFGIDIADLVGDTAIAPGRNDTRAGSDHFRILYLHFALMIAGRAQPRG